MATKKILHTLISYHKKEEAIELIKNNPGYYLFVNTNTMVEGQNNNLLKKSLLYGKNFPDGFPLIWIARLSGIKAERISGPDLLPDFLNYLETGGEKCCFIGGNSLQAKTRIKKIKNLYPLLSFISLSHHDPKHLEKINEFNPEYVLVSIGSPLQEIWAYQNHKIIRAKILCIGVALPYLIGEKTRAPYYMRMLNLEWLYRLLSEPKHVWKRYLINGPKFLMLLIKDFIVKSRTLKS